MKHLYIQILHYKGTTESLYKEWTTRYEDLLINHNDPFGRRIPMRDTAKKVIEMLRYNKQVNMIKITTANIDDICLNCHNNANISVNINGIVYALCKKCKIKMAYKIIV